MFYGSKTSFVLYNSEVSWKYQVSPCIIKNKNYNLISFHMKQKVKVLNNLEKNLQNQIVFVYKIFTIIQG